MTSSGTYIDTSWYVSEEGKSVMSSLVHKPTNKRKIFGLLERPSFPPQSMPDEYQYKIFVSGRSGIGKTSTVAKLVGSAIPETHMETPGIQSTCVYWPAKMADLGKVIMFNLDFWDAGENALRKFDHILPACREGMDGAIFLFSFTDKSSFQDLPQQMSRVLPADSTESKLVIGTKYDIHSRVEVTLRDLQEFEQQWRLPVMRICNKSQPNQSGESEINEIAPLLTAICEKLWHRDQLLTGKVVSNNLSSEPQITFC